MLRCPKCDRELKPDVKWMKLLTPHQRRIAITWAETMDLTTTARMLGMNVHCVVEHLRRMREKLGVDSPRELLLLLYGLLDGCALGLNLDVKAASR